MKINYFDYVKTIRDYMLKNNYSRLYLKNYLEGFNEKESIMFNKYYSPNGAKGMFLILSRERFNKDMNKSFFNLELRLSDIYNCEGSKIQDKFEKYTEKILKENNLLYNYVPKEKMSDYDYYVNNEYTIEVKSDKWLKTGNLSLELMRDYLYDYKRNVGSILKTKADYWFFYFYDYKDGKVVSEIYNTEQLKKFVYNILEKLYYAVDIV